MGWRPASPMARPQFWMRSCGGYSPSISKLRARIFQQQESRRAGQHVGRHLGDNFARALRQVPFAKSRKAVVWKIIGQKDGVPGRLFLTRCRVDFFPGAVHCRPVSTTSA